MTSTGRSTRARSTQSAIEAPRDGEPEKSVGSPESGEATRAVERDLARIPEELADSALAAACLAMARELDSPINSATSKSMCAKALLDILNRLHELIPADEERDDLDDLATRRAARLAGGATA